MKTPEMIRTGAPIDEIEARLDLLQPDERITEVRTWSAKDLRVLYELTADRPAPKAHFVPPSVPDGVPVRHFGINSLPLFREFEKRFLRDQETGDAMVARGEVDMIGTPSDIWLGVPLHARGEVIGAIVLLHTCASPLLPPRSTAAAHPRRRWIETARRRRERS